MNYYINVFSPETYEAFTKSNMTVSGVSKRFKKFAQSIKPGDKFICYLTKISRWCGILEVLSECFEDDSPIFCSEQDPYIIRFKVKPLIWLPLDKSIPIYDDNIWNNLSFTKNCDKNSATWTIKFRSSLSKLSKSDGVILKKILKKQKKSGNIYKLTEDDKKKLKTYKIIISNTEVDVSVPEEDTEPVINNENKHIKESTRIQYLLAKLGERMGFSIWLPKNNRTELHKLWKPIREDSLLNVLPLNYDDVTLKTIEQIDVLWIKKKTIIRAFEVEHTTSIYSGILRMADLMALQPNLNIKTHLVAPVDRRDKVFQEIKRPVFMLMEKGPLYQYCTYLSYDSIEELCKEKHMEHMSDSVLDEYIEVAEI